MLEAGAFVGLVGAVMAAVGILMGLVGEGDRSDGLLSGLVLGGSLGFLLGLCVVAGSLAWRL